MTPREVLWRLDAETERENREFERIAQLACWVMNPWITNKRDQYSVRKLLTRGKAAVKAESWQEWVK